MPELLSLPNLFAWAIQSACIALAAAVVLRVVPMPSAEVRYAVWRVALLACFAVPWLPAVAGWTRPALADAAALPFAGPLPSFEVVDATVPTAILSWSSIAWGALGLVVALRAIWLLSGVVRLARLRRAGAVADTEEFADAQRALAIRAEIRYVSDLAQPVTFGLRVPVVLLPASLADGSETLRRAVTMHELLHVQRRDWGWVIVEEALRTICVCNPAIWWLTSRVQQAREEVVDHLTVLAIGSRRDYIAALLAFADAPSPAPAPAFARRAQLFTRIVRISRETSMSSVRVLLSALAMLVVVGGAGLYARTTFPLTDAAQQIDPNAPVQAITPENPVPRRVYAVAMSHPVGFEDLNAVTQVRVRLDAFGVPTVIGPGASAISIGRTAAARQNPLRFGATNAGAIDAFYRTAAEAIAEWRYEPPAAAPIEFVIAVRFTPGEVPTVSQMPYSRTVSAGPDGIQLGGRMPAALERARSELRRAREAQGRSATTDAVRVGGLVKPPVNTRNVKPVYPPEAMQARVEGTVRLEVVVDDEGRVADATILESIPLLDQAALDAVRQWQFTPTLVNGVPTRIIVTCEITFTLRS